MNSLYGHDDDDGDDDDDNDDNNDPHKDTIVFENASFIK